MLTALTVGCVLVGCSDSDAPSVDEKNIDGGALTAADADVSAAGSNAHENDASTAVGHEDGAVIEDLDASDMLDASISEDVDAMLATDASDIDAMLPSVEELPYARDVVSFTPGAHAGFGQTKLPDVVLGPPKGSGTGGGSLDVLSLGMGGTIVLDFGTRDIVDGAGADFIVFENPFWASGDPKMVFAEPAEVSVSTDGTTWHTFPCDAAGDGMGKYVGCAGWTPTLKYDAFTLLPLDPKKTGGDAFDLDDLGLSSARYVKIHDLATTGTANSAGFDLDAVGIVHAGEQP